MLIEKLIKAISDEFQRFGFKALNPVSNDEKGEVHFDVEIPVGQMSFFIKNIQCWFNYHTSGKRIQQVNLHVSYRHIGGGSNGSNVYYFVVCETKYGDDEYTLVRSDLYNMVSQALQKGDDDC